MFYKKLGLVIGLVLTGCAEASIEQTVICWEAGDETELPAGKFYPLPGTICVPIAYAPVLPPSIYQRAIVRNDVPRDKGKTPPNSPTPGDDDFPSRAPEVLESSEITNSGPIAMTRRSDDTIEYSAIVRNSGIVRAVDDKTVTNSNDARRLREEIFREVGL